MSKTFLTVLLSATLMTSGPLAAQDADDWDFGRAPDQDATIAAVTFDTMGVAVRCMGDSLSVLLSGMPAGSGERPIRVAIGDGPEQEGMWVSARDSGTLFAVWPRGYATDLARGGQLRISVPDGSTSVRYAVDLPRSEAAIAQVFQACGQSLDQGSDRSPSGVSMAGLNWLNPPEINFPGQSRYEGGIAALICTTRSDGRLEDCSIESEFPAASGFGRASARGAHRTGRVEAVDGGDADIGGRRIAFLTRFSTNFTPRSDLPTRIPGRN
ncbi:MULTISPECIES: hypothetical protein [Brevundimonas]|uniref:hypothetical protein n=1 Tax=Brevundimonas TaxID=41275 RepID=UPI0013CE7DE8|nr:hypothetical protein [Brevundimonas lutea]